MRITTSFLLAGWLVGGLEAAFVQTTESRPLVIAFGAALATVPALLLGVGAWLGAKAIERLPGTAQMTAWFDRIGGTVRKVEREPVLYANSYMFAGIIVLVLTSLAALFMYPRLFKLQLTEMATEFAILFAAALVYAALVGVILISIALERPMRAVERRFGLPRPRALWLRYLLVVTLPVFLGLYPFVFRHRHALGDARDLSSLVLLAVAGIQVTLIRSTWRPAQRRSLPIAVVALAVLLVGASAFAYDALRSTAAASEAALLPSVGGRVARVATDFDLDGVSSLFGGRDCAPFDPGRAPNQTEIDGNGIDEDCDGSDNRRAAAKWKADSAAASVSPAQVRKYNILWIVLEAVRADHLPAYGYPKATMPYFSSLAEESLLFENAYAQSSATVFSMQSMLSGVLPASIQWEMPPVVPGVYGSGQPLIAETHPMIAERLAAHEYRSAIVLENYNYQTMPGLRRGFQKAYRAEPDRSRRINRPRRNAHAYAKAADFIARIKPNQHFFLLVYFFDSHGGYTRHADIDNSEFARDSQGDYDSELAWTDEWLRALVELIRSRRMMWEDTIIIITADHGEEFMEHGRGSHAQTCYREVSQVPLLVRVPGIAPRRVASRVALVDIVPTIMDLVGDESSRDGLDGQSLLVPALRPELVDRERPVFCSIASINSKYGTFFRRSVRQGDYVLLHDASTGDLELYNTAVDPSESRELSGNPKHAERAAVLTSLLDATRTGNMHDHEHMRPNAGDPNVR